MGISGALHPGLGFFGRLCAAALNPPCGEVCPVRVRASVQLFHVPQQSQVDELGPLSTPAVLRSRRVIRKHPTRLRAFWLKPVSLFGLLNLTVLDERLVGFNRVILF